MLHTLQRCLYALPLTLLLGGCATYDPNTHYDPDAVEKVGVITAKSLVLEKYQLKPRGSDLPVPVNGTIKMVYLPDVSAGGSRYREVYLHVVAISAHESVTVLSTYPAFKVGDCVKIFLSSRPSYPRIASGSGCDTEQRATVPVMASNEGAKLQARVQQTPHLATRGVASHTAFMAESAAVHGVQCEAVQRCITVGEGSSQQAQAYIQQVVKKISGMGHVYLAGALQSDSGEQMVTTRVMLASDGKLQTVSTISGDSVRTRRIEELFRVAAPYALFTDPLREQADMIVADITFHFEDDRLVNVRAADLTQ